MIQRFIELGEGYSDIYELIEITKSNAHRLAHMVILDTAIGDKEMVSLAVVLRPAETGKFQPIYMCREGIPNPKKLPNKRFQLFADTAKELNKEIIELKVKPSMIFPETILYYQHLIGIFRLNHLIAPLQ